MGRLIGGSGSSFGMMFGGRGWKREMEGVLEERRGESVGRSVCVRRGKERGRGVSVSGIRMFLAFGEGIGERQDMKEIVQIV